MFKEITERIEKIGREEVPEGYRKTKIGMVPETWEDTTLDRLLVEKVEKTSNVVDYPLYSLTLENGIIEKSERYDREHLVKKQEGMYKLVHSNEFAYNPMNIRFGAVARNKSGKTISVSGYYDVFEVKCAEDRVFIENFLISEQMKRHYNRICTGSLDEKKRVHFSEFLRIKVPIPSEEERKELSKILKMQDKKIELLEKQIGEAEQKKKWLMQILLNGIIRLPEATGKWKTEKMNSVFSERKETNCQDCELLSITSRGIFPRTEIEGKDNSSEDKSKYKKICIGDIGYNTMRMWQGVSALSRYEGIVSPAYTVLKPKKNINAQYFSFLFRLPSSVFKFYRFSQGLVDDTRNLKYEDFKNISFSYPEDVEEQKEIANVLNCAQREIELLQKKLVYVKKEKTALMQYLLTGVVRVNELLGREVN